MKGDVTFDRLRLYQAVLVTSDSVNDRSAARAKPSNVRRSSFTFDLREREAGEQFVRSETCVDGSGRQLAFVRFLRERLIDGGIELLLSGRMRIWKELANQSAILPFSVQFVVVEDADHQLA